MLSRIKPDMIFKAVQIRWKRWRINLSLWRLARAVNRHAPRLTKQVQRHTNENSVKPVVFFNASTRLVGVSQNAAFALLSAAGLQLAGIPVIYFGCKAGMRRCVLGTRLDDLSEKPPCRSCTHQAKWLFAHAPSVGFQFKGDPALVAELSSLDLPGLIEYECQGLPLGSLVLPSMRWVLRRHHLQDDGPTRQLYCDYIESAFHLAHEFTTFLTQVEPQAVVVFNGMFFPEAVVRFVAQEHGLPVITHEVGLRPFTAFFTRGQATAYPLDIPDDFRLNEAQNARLDRYLEQRMQGNFSMAGIQFWRGMQGLGEAFERKASGFRQIVSVFTNVVFDTSQPHSNVVFEHMFDWLELVVELAEEYPDTLFVLRAHPDENRMWKESRESVSQWVAGKAFQADSNILFIGPDQTISSYELISRSKFIMIYNSTIGLEASILGAAVLCAGRARFTQLPTVFFPQTVAGFRQTADEFLKAERVEAPSAFRLNARRFLYYQLFRSSLPFDHFIEADRIWPGFVRLKSFSWQDLTVDRSAAMQTIIDGLENGHEFILPEEFIRG